MCNSAFICKFYISGDKSSSDSNIPPPSLLKVVASWVSNSPDLCLTTCPTALLTAGRLRGSLAPPESTPLPSGPVLGLLRWVVLMPLASYFAASDAHTLHESRLLYSQLHLAIIQAFLCASKEEENPQDEMELEPGEVMDESDSRHLIKGTDLRELTRDMTKLIDKFKTVEFNHSFSDQQVQLSLDRFAQTLQVAIATGCLSATKGKSLLLSESFLCIVCTIFTKPDTDFFFLQMNCFLCVKVCQLTGWSYLQYTELCLSQLPLGPVLAVRFREASAL